MHIAIITAGGAGMFCGSCMHDNTWARSLQNAGEEISLIPTYTPIRVDEQDATNQQVFFGGVNVYLEYRSRIWRTIPRLFTRWLDAPWIIDLATRFGVDNDAHHLGALTVAMLQGEAGPQHREVDELVDHLVKLNPDVICFSNALLVGCLKQLKKKFSGKVFCILQGDDVYIDALTDPYQKQAIELMSERAQEFDGFLVHSQYYREYMSGYLNLPVEKFHHIPLGIDLEGHDGQPGSQNNQQFTIGYFARICPEKGLHHLVSAFSLFHEKYPDTRLRAGGYLGKNNRRYFQTVQRETSQLGSAFEFIGSPATHAEKVEFLKSLDVLSVPTEYHEPKGIYVLEALANGVPVVQPRHGAFPELIEATSGGLLVDSNNPQELADGFEKLYLDAEQRTKLGSEGQSNIRSKFDPKTMAETSLAIFKESLSK